MEPSTHHNDSLKVSRKHSPQDNTHESPPGVDRTKIKQMEQSLSVTKNRVALLRQQLQKEKDSIKKNKNLTKETIAKKVAVNEVNMYKQKDNTEESIRIERLRQRNKSMRLEHERSL